MDEQELRRITQAVRPELRQLIGDDAVVAEVDTAMADALALPPGEAKGALRDALARHVSVRAWLSARMPEEAERRRTVPLPLGDPTSLVYVRYVCPEGDEDFFQSRTDEQVPTCGVHGVPLRREDD